MLWTDRDFVTGADLITLDAEVEDVAAAQGITLDDPNIGLIHRSLAESASALMKYQQVFGGYLTNQNISGNHYNAVMNVGLPAVNRSRILMSQVVVDALVCNEWSVLKTWAAYKSLARFFTDAANRTLKDRYETKALRYKKEVTSTYFEAVRALGLPIVRQPLPCPGAVYEIGTGNWGAANVTTAAGAGTDITDTFDFAITWVDQSMYVGPTNKQNCESGTSAIVSLQLPSTGNVFVVNINGLNPPVTAQPNATLPVSVVAYGNATGWNLYVGLTGETLYLQNATPIPVAIKSYALPTDPVTSGFASDMGQFPELYFTFQNIIQRA